MTKIKKAVKKSVNKKDDLKINGIECVDLTNYETKIDFESMVMIAKRIYKNNDIDVYDHVCRELNKLADSKAISYKSANIWRKKIPEQFDLCEQEYKAAIQHILPPSKREIQKPKHKKIKQRELIEKDLLELDLVNNNRRKFGEILTDRYFPELTGKARESKINSIYKDSYTVSEQVKRKKKESKK
jgi:hypothetical protein